MPWILAGVGRSVHQLRTPEVADLVAVPMKDCHHRHLESFGCLGAVVALEAISSSRKQSQIPPSALLCEGDQVLERRLVDDHEISPLIHVLRGAVQLVKERGT